MAISASVFLAFSSSAIRQKELTVDPQKLSFSGDLTPEETGLITVEVLDSDRLGAARAPRLFVRLVDDQTPRLEYKALGIGPMITPQARIPGSLAVRDDFGLTRLAAGMRIAGGESAASQPTSSTSETMFEPVTFLGLEGFRPGAVEFANLVLLDLLPMNSDPDPASAKNRMHPDQTLSLRFTAGDNFGPGAPHEGESEVVTFRLVTRDRLIDELQRRQEEQRKELTQIIEQQKLELSDLKSIVSPTSADPRAKQAVARLAAMARAQRSLGKRTQQVAQRYKQILDEMANNRLLEETQVRVLESQIVQPLQPIAADDFPTSAHLTEEFSTGGKDDVRSSAVAAYESILFKLEQVLKHMHELENLAAITRDLRELIQQESDLSNEAQRRLRETFNSLPGAGSQPTTKKK